MTRRLHLVRHGAPLPDPALPGSQWRLDPAGAGDLRALRDSGSLPAGARWFSSPEPKALGTARALTDTPVEVVPELREHEREATPWFDDPAEWRAVITRMFERPDASALPGWEPLARTRDRVVPAVRRLLAAHPGEELVLAGHATAWTTLRAALRGAQPDIDWWASLGLPDHRVIDVP